MQLHTQPTVALPDAVKLHLLRRPPPAAAAGQQERAMKVITGSPRLTESLDAQRALICQSSLLPSLLPLSGQIRAVKGAKNQVALAL